ncbi:hypothetical protein OOT00_04920 [Desulfobotulus sp. H1]|uniref:TIGR03016 family PEP-CTERM system-associated outer membrane protein n=1 Tax=Desulfobotulus pelophilus TaxID=2823377 RepID=A0ABT3N793_9BACT|nr:hypothetical protein [Desulfobotulus pelophilus]MCW7753327.1 hypothetical protein [Desulfobotulus pelophilus]
MGPISVMVMLIGSFCFLPAWAAMEKEPSSDWHISGSSETGFQWRDSNDPDADHSSGSYFFQEISLSAVREKMDGSRGFRFRGRSTNDSQIDDEDFRLLYINGFARKGEAHIEIGDVAAAYNPMVLSASVKGAKLEYGRHREYGWRLSSIAGVDKDHWDDLYGSKDPDPVDRYLAGLETRLMLGGGQEIAFSASGVRDSLNADAIPLDPKKETVPVKALTTGVQWDWRFNNYLRTRGEGAFSRSSEDTRETGKLRESGAVRIRLLTVPVPQTLNVNLLYERIEPDFISPAGSAVRDRERLESDTSLTISPALKARFLFQTYHDNLNRELSETFEVNDGTLDLHWQPGWMSQGKILLSTRHKQSRGRGRDQDLRMGEIRNEYKTESGWKYGLGWTVTDIKAGSDRSKEQQIHTLMGLYGLDRELANDHVWRSTLRLDANFMDKEEGGETALGGRLDLGYEAGKHWSAGLGASTRRVYVDHAEDSEYRSYELRGHYHPGGNRARAIRFSAGMREFENKKGLPVREHVTKVAYHMGF